MNEYQSNLYSQLMTLVENSKNDKRPTFVYKDVPCVDNSHITYRIFNYQLPKYQDFLKEGAMQCRGTMFVLDKKNNTVQLASLPMDKFFGLGENPSTMNLSFEDIKEAYVKVDGSLLSTYIRYDGSLGFKSKSEPVFAFSNLVEEYLSNHEALKADLLQMTVDGYTVDLEFVSTENRVILEYKESALHILNVRNRETGDYVDFRDLNFLSKYPYISNYLVKSMPISEFKDLNNNNKLLSLQNIEGAVVRLHDGRLVKIKTEWYMSQHNYVNIQDFSKAGKKLFMVVMNEATDELRSLLHYRNKSPNFKLEEKLAYIDKAEETIQKVYGEFLDTVGAFFEKNKHLEYSEFLKKAKSELPPNLIGMVMPLHQGKIKNLKEAFIINYQNKIKL